MARRPWSSSGVDAKITAWRPPPPSPPRVPAGRGAEAPPVTSPSTTRWALGSKDRYFRSSLRCRSAPAGSGYPDGRRCSADPPTNPPCGRRRRHRRRPHTSVGSCRRRRRRGRRLAPPPPGRSQQTVDTKKTGGTLWQVPVGVQAPPVARAVDPPPAHTCPRSAQRSPGAQKWWPRVHPRATPAAPGRRGKRGRHGSVAGCTKRQR